MRNTFINTITELAEMDERIVLLTADLGYKIFDNFAKKFPNRFYNVGIAEANMVGVAAGLASFGMRPYVYSIVPFATLRCCEQIRDDVAYNNLNVKIVGVGGGYAYGFNGPTHHGIEDISVMRSIPNLNVLCPGDSLETENIIISSWLGHAPTYIRLGRGGEPKVHKSLSKGILKRVNESEDFEDLIIFSCGGILSIVDSVNALLRKKDIKSTVVSVPYVKPLYGSLIADMCRQTKNVVTVEEQTIVGGFGGAVAECLMEDRIFVGFKRFGIRDMFIHTAGDQEYLRNLAGLSVELLYKNILEFLKNNE
ncbi:hypothetical protein HYV49_03355 [Candidatus Pacearchaeota archaeon]|nr:hypothetical protein [Candidatus Pacearchaeota archaeon]